MNYKICVLHWKQNQIIEPDIIVLCKLPLDFIFLVVMSEYHYYDFIQNILKLKNTIFFKRI